VAELAAIGPLGKADLADEPRLDRCCNRSNRVCFPSKATISPSTTSSP
jgi:hypothetical protein